MYPISKDKQYRRIDFGILLRNKATTPAGAASFKAARVDFQSVTDILQISRFARAAVPACAISFPKVGHQDFQSS